MNSEFPAKALVTKPGRSAEPAVFSLIQNPMVLGDSVRLPNRPGTGCREATQLAPLFYDSGIAANQSSREP